ncbi:hypothetical protein PsYK624_114390 [Phanerochaete sordida]|uniref:Uncharacterized protein n=1 Tax=Phanerochaete sordida TaxID=48140 RepID=A0A9P3GHX4_9APHY|nr:hypothetical protein PsYK624_114390 [Phanerochaete sordida]
MCTVEAKFVSLPPDITRACNDISSTVPRPTTLATSSSILRQAVPAKSTQESGRKETVPPEGILGLMFDMINFLQHISCGAGFLMLTLFHSTFPIGIWGAGEQRSLRLAPSHHTQAKDTHLCCL